MKALSHRQPGVYKHAPVCKIATHSAGQMNSTDHIASHGPASSWKLPPASMKAWCLAACANQAVSCNDRGLAMRSLSESGNLDSNCQA